MTEPKLRFAEFTDEWKVLKLSDIADRINRKNFNNETDLPLTISSLAGLVDQRTYFNKVVASKDMSGYYLLKNGEFAYNKSYSVGYDYGSIKRLDKFDIGALSNLYICFSLKDTKQSDFIVRYFDSQKWYKGVYAICAEGARNHGLLNVPANDFFNIKICLPKDKKEEEKILELFASIDNVISAIDSEVALWEEKKKGVMQKIFSQEVRFKKEDGSDYPEWENVKLHTLCSKIGSGKTPKGGKQVYQSNGIMLIRSQNVHNRKLLTDNVTYISNEINNTMLSTVVNEKDVLLNITGASIGRCCLYNVQKEANVNQHVCIIRIRDWNIAEPLYIVDYILSDYFQNQINMLQNGGSREGLNFQQIENMDVMLPSIPEQRKISNMITDLDEVINIKQQKLESWKSIKKGLLQQMFV